MSKFLTYDERLEIQKGLKNQLSFEQKTGYSSYPYNACKHRKTCTKKNICPLGCTRPSKYKCSLCTLCNDICEDFVAEVCTKKIKPPYVCNGCKQLNNGS